MARHLRDTPAVTFYGPDLAHVHDAGFGFLARAAAPAVVARLRAAGIDGGLVVDLGCGSGIAARILIDAGYSVHGIDQSPDLIAIARERAPEATFECASLHDAELPPDAVAVTATGEILCYSGIDQRLLERVCGALAPGGMFLFDIATPGREDPEPRRSWHEGSDWLVCVEAWEDAGGVRLTRRIATFRRAGDAADAWTRSDEVHELELYEPEPLADALRAAGFASAEVVEESYAPETRIRGLVVLCARAP